LRSKIEKMLESQMRQITQKNTDYKISEISVIINNQ